MKNIVVAGLLAMWATGALAHSQLASSTPAHKASVTVVPTQVLLTFNGDIRLTRVTLTHADTQHMDMDLGDQTAFTQTFAVPMHDMGTGAYEVEWRGLGVDGHAMNGTFRFTVE